MDSPEGTLSHSPSRSGAKAWVIQKILFRVLQGRHICNPNVNISSLQDSNFFVGCPRPPLRFDLGYEIASLWD